MGEPQTNKRKLDMLQEDATHNIDTLSDFMAPHKVDEPAQVTCFREWIGKAQRAIDANDYKLARTFVRLAHSSAEAFHVKDNGVIEVRTSKWIDTAYSQTDRLITS
jgi:hypothetical protein